MARSMNVAVDDMLHLCVSGDFHIDAAKNNQIIIKKVQNMPLRGNIWPLNASVVHAKKNIILLSDIRGEVYVCNLLTNKYHLIKLASSKLSTMCFLHGTNDMCLLAYENRDVLIVDMNKKAVVHQVDIPNSVVRLVRCHPTKSLVAMATDQQEIMIYDFVNSNQFYKLKELKCNENIVDIQYEHHGSLIAVTLQHSGTYFYRLSDYELIVECPLPKSERKTSWISYCCQVTPGGTGEDNTINMRIILGSSDGKLYVWNALSVVAESVESGYSSQKAFLTGIVDLPVRYPLAIKLFTVNVLTMYAARICVCSSNGEIVIVDINDSGLTTAGAWILAHTVEADELHNVNHGISYVPFTVGASDALVTETDDGTKVFNAYDGMVHTNGKIMVSVGCDGVARIINTSGFKISYKGKLLHVRGPYPVVELAEPTPVKSAMKGKKSSTPSTSTTFSPHTRDLSTQYIRERENIAKVGNVSASPRDEEAEVPIRKREVMSLPTPPPPTYNDTYTGESLTSSKASHQHKGRVPPVTGFMDSTVDMHSSNAVGATSGHLFELTGLTPEETIVNENKLREFLAAFGEYPERYRGLIWQFLLKLPVNSSEYDRLAALGVHHKYERFYLSHSMKSQSQYERLQTLCSVISHWAPPLGHAAYLPQLVFPFQMLFPEDKDNITVVEIMLSFMMWYGFSWHIAYPDEPILIIESLNDILKLHDMKLHHHFDRLDVSVGKIGWRMISTGFSEVLSRSNWLKLFDFLFTNIHIPEYIMLVPIAIMRIVRSSFFHIGTEEHITAYFSNQQTLSMKEVISLCEEMHSSTPPRHFIALTSPDQLKLKQSLPTNDDDDDDGKTAKRPTQMIDTESLSGPLFPLPSGKYPAYDGYPRFLLEWEEKNDMEEAELKSELLRKELILKDIQRSIAQIDADHELWMSRHQASIDSERRHKLEMIENEKKTMDTLQRMEEKISKQRLTALATLETVTQQEIEAMSQVESETRLLADATTRHHKDKVNFVENMAKHRLLAAQAELASEERYHKLRTRRARDNLLRSIGDTINSKLEEMECTKEKLNHTWVVEDEELRVQWNKKIEKLQDFNENMTVKRLEKEMSVRLKELEVANKLEVLNLSNQRERREMMDKVTNEEENRVLALPSVDEMTSFIETQLALDSENGVVAAQRKLMLLVDEIRDISNNLISNETTFLQKYEEEKLQLLKSELKKQWTDRLGLQLQSIMKAISILQENMVLLKFSALKIDYHNKNVENTASILKNVTSSATVNESQITRLGQDIINRQRERFNEMHQALLSLISTSAVSMPLNTHGNTDDFTASMNEMLLPLGETVSKVSSRLLLTKPSGKARSDSSGSEGAVDIDQLIEETMRKKSSTEDNKKKTSAVTMRNKVTRSDETVFVDAALDRSIDNDATLMWGGGSSSDDSK